jgi:roadblock/LC7 domain-containing protein
MFGGSELYDSAISPDGRRVAFRVQSGGSAAIWISPLSGDAPVRLWNDPADSPQRAPSWSPDGSWVAYHGVHDGRFAVMKARIGGTSTPEFLAGVATFAPVRWSPRGDWIVFGDGEVLRVVSPYGKQNRVISRRIWETYGWSADGGSVYSIQHDSRRLAVMRFDLANQNESRIADVGPVPATVEFISDYLSDFPYRGFSLHPDGRSFLTSVQRVRTQLYLMTDFDRTFRLADRWFGRP